CDAVDLAEIIRGKFQGSCSNVLPYAPQFGGAGDWNDPWLLCQQPGERNLRCCCPLLRGKCGNYLHESSIRFAGLVGKAREASAVVPLEELCLRGNCAGKKPSAKRAIRDQANPKFLERWQYFFFWTLPP